MDTTKYIDANEDDFGNDNPNAASVLKCIHALLTVVEGLLSGSSDMISRCLDGFWEAERLANECDDKEWMGNRVSRGISYLFGGLLQVFIRSYVKAGLNLTVGYKLLHDLEKDLLEYNDSSDREIVRSFGLLGLAILNFFSLILPPSVASIGNLLGLSISRDKFHEYINACMNEGGEFSVIAKLIYVYYVINSKSFMFDKTDPAELAQCRTLINSCLLIHQESVIVHVMNASVFLGEGNPDGAVETLTRKCVQEVIDRPEWATMGLAVYFKLGVSNLCRLNFSAAMDAFHKAGDAIDRTGKWNYIPFMRTLEGMSYMAASINSVRSKAESSIGDVRKIAEKNFAPTYIDHDMSGNPIVLPGDLWGSRMRYEYGTLLDTFSDEELREFFVSRTPLVDILYGMVTCLYCFDKIDLSRISLDDLDAIKRHSSKRSQLVLGEYYRKKGDYEESVANFDDAIEIADSNLQEGLGDKESILAFSLVFQGAALCFTGDGETAQDVLNDLDSVLGDSRYLKGAGIAGGGAGNFFKSIMGSHGSQHAKIKPGNLVNVNGGEFEIMLNFRRNALKQKIDQIFGNDPTNDTNSNIDS